MFTRLGRTALYRYSVITEERMVKDRLEIELSKQCFKIQLTKKNDFGMRMARSSRLAISFEMASGTWFNVQVLPDSTSARSSSMAGKKKGSSKSTNPWKKFIKIIWSIFLHLLLILPAFFQKVVQPLISLHWSLAAKWARLLITTNCCQ